MGGVANLVDAVGGVTVPRIKYSKMKSWYMAMTRRLERRLGDHGVQDGL